MSVDEIKKAVLGGKTVHYKSESYKVVCHEDQWLIVSLKTSHRIGLTWADGETMNGKPTDFFIKKGKAQ